MAWLQLASVSCHDMIQSRALRLQDTFSLVACLILTPRLHYTSQPEIILPLLLGLWVGFLLLACTPIELRDLTWQGFDLQHRKQ